MKLLPKIPFLKSIPKRLLSPPHFEKPDVKDLHADMEALGEQIAEGFKAKVIENIQKNTYGFSDAPSTIKRKGSSTPLIDTGEYLSSIYREGTTVSVEDTPRRNGFTNKQLAISLEYGTKDKHIPARPVWRNTFADYKEEARKQVEEFFATQKFKDESDKEQDVSKTKKEKTSRSHKTGRRGIIKRK